MKFNPSLHFNGPRRVSEETRFWSKVCKLGPNDCWKWQASKTKGGYGRFRLSIGDKKTLAHRYAYKITIGTVSDNLDVLHKCDNPPCCNPSHLFIGNDLINSQDKVAKNRQLKGNQIFVSKLNESKVKLIRSLYATGKTTQKKLGLLWGVSSQTISFIVRRITWKHV